MKYEQCLSCNELGKTCDGPNFLAMDTAELGLWCKEKLQLIPGITYDKVAAETGISKSTIYGFLNGTHTDYRIETIRPIVKMIVGGHWDDNPCGNVSNTEKAKYEETIRHLEDEIRFRDEKLQHFKEQNQKLQAHIGSDSREHAVDQAFMRKQIRGKNTAIVALSITLAVTLFVIIAALAVDKFNPGLGFFW